MVELDMLEPRVEAVELARRPGRALAAFKDGRAPKAD